MGETTRARQPMRQHHKPAATHVIPSPIRYPNPRIPPSDASFGPRGNLKLALLALDRRPSAHLTRANGEVCLTRVFPATGAQV